MCGMQHLCAAWHAERHQHDDAKVKDYGVRLATAMIKEITASGLIHGVHFCTLNLEMSVRRVLEALEWKGSSGRDVNRLIMVKRATYCATAH